MPDLSIVVPAHNEEAFIEPCLRGIQRAQAEAEMEVELIVVLNRCTDRTEEIARRFGAIIVREDEANLSKIRNAGVAAASSPIVVTCDADSIPHQKIFAVIREKLASGRFVGGGTVTLPERWSIGIFASLMAIMPYLIWHRVSFGLFWFRAEDFRAIGGFDERMLSVEDLDMARRLRAHGRKTGRKFGTIVRAPLTTSCRKFDQFGDWYLLTDPVGIWRAFGGSNRAVADKYWYEVGR
ncbi:MAG: glycosyltransferase [Verrucomicrobiota bacterium JB023]|nr:glycosyltransferase [Verrucomicrobiota bacterium JB023]